MEKTVLKAVETKKNRESEYDPDEMLCAKVRTVLHLGTAEQRDATKKVVEALYEPLSMKMKTQGVETAGENKLIAVDLFNEIHRDLSKAIAVADVLEQAIQEEASLLDQSASYTLVTIREIIESVQQRIEDAADGK